MKTSTDISTYINRHKNGVFLGIKKGLFRGDGLFPGNHSVTRILSLEPAPIKAYKRQPHSTNGICHIKLFFLIISNL